VRYAIDVDRISEKHNLILRITMDYLNRELLFKIIEQSRKIATRKPKKSNQDMYCSNLFLTTSYLDIISWKLPQIFNLD